MDEKEKLSNLKKRSRDMPWNATLFYQLVLFYRLAPGWGGQPVLDLGVPFRLSEAISWISRKEQKISKYK